MLFLVLGLDTFEIMAGPSVKPLNILNNLFCLQSSVKRMDVKKMEDSKTEIPLNDCMAGGCMESTTTSERLICDGYKWDEKTRCGAPPDMDELWEGKENGLRFELNYHRTNVLPENMEGNETEASVVIDKSIFLDDDSNQVLPVEKFFGNMEVVQVRGEFYKKCLV